MSAEIAINTKHYGDRSKDSRGYAEPMNREQVDSLLSEKWIRDMVADIRGGNNKANLRHSPI